MPTYKLKAKIDESGNLVLTEPIKLPPGEVEVILLQPLTEVDNTAVTPTTTDIAKSKRQIECNVPILKEWLEQTEPFPPDFDPDQAKWEYLQEKHNL
ncbi:MAG TPA: hypothetical protein IGS52_18525 [Oscillatoriaceae cyanobacterium M33_DOE_052]|uniref:Uncharacterized protein n=1 Tax=Planktothricoides sp. SpSt-374 TaxID=2282167 RepID=A0A7C3VN78_9CYAN|nr:hypothetical protein [Oscillatoriaceae cyanobacterium M33_DOE_052]